MLIHDIVQKYSECNSYADRGRVITHFSAETSPLTLDFATRFTRSVGCEMHWQTYPYRHQVVQHQLRLIVGQSLLKLDSAGGRELVFRDLSNGLRAASSLSSGAASAIMPLLLPMHLKDHSLFQRLKDAEISTEASTDGIPLFKIIGSIHKPEDIELLVEQDNLIIRRILKRLFTSAAERTELSQIRSTDPLTAIRLGDVELEIPQYVDYKFDTEIKYEIVLSKVQFDIDFGPEFHEKMTR